MPHPGAFISVRPGHKNWLRNGGAPKRWRDYIEWLRHRFILRAPSQLPTILRFKLQIPPNLIPTLRVSLGFAASSAYGYPIGALRFSPPVLVRSNRAGG